MRKYSVSRNVAAHQFKGVRYDNGDRLIHNKIRGLDECNSAKVEWFLFGN